MGQKNSLVAWKLVGELDKLNKLDVKEKDRSSKLKREGHA